MATYTINHPAFPADIEKRMRAYKLPTLKPGKARTKRQKEIEAASGKTYLWPVSFSKTVWGTPAVYPADDILRLTDDSVTAGWASKDPAPGILGGAMSADSPKDASVLEQGGTNMQALDQMVQALGYTTAILRYSALVRSRSAGCVPRPHKDEPVYRDAFPRTFEYRASLNVNRVLPRFRDALLKADFKEQEMHIFRPGFAAGLFHYDGGFHTTKRKDGSIYVNSMDITHDVAALDALIKLFGKPSYVEEVGNGLHRTFWTASDLPRIMKKMHNDLGGALAYLNPRKLAIARIATNQ